MMTPGVDPCGDEIHVWWSALDAPGWRAASERTLNPDERLRADRYRFEADRRRFVARRALLRLLLSRYTGIAPAELEFSYGHAGKPELARRLGPADIRFNASHSSGLALFVIARGRRVGVDVETLRPLPDLDEVARACLTAHEYATLQSLPPNRRNGAFLTAWTLKEAFVKATGDGLTLSPERIEVTFDPDGAATLSAVDGNRHAAAWSLRTLPTGRAHAGAVAVERRIGRLVWRRFAPWDGDRAEPALLGGADLLHDPAVLLDTAHGALERSIDLGKGEMHAGRRVAASRTREDQP